MLDTEYASFEECPNQAMDCLRIRWVNAYAGNTDREYRTLAGRSAEMDPTEMSP